MLLLALLSPTLAQSPVLSQAKDGQLTLPVGELYVPSNLNWKEERAEDLLVLRGEDKSSDLSLCVVVLKKTTVVDTPHAVELVEKHVLPANQKLKLKEAVSAPYPWPDSLELRLDNETPHSIYVASASGHTLVISGRGQSGPESANRAAANFKENFALNRESQARGSTAKKIQSMLATSATFLLVTFALFPVAILLFMNRKDGTKRNPFEYGQKAIASGVVLVLIFDCVVLSRFSWVSIGDYVQAIGGGLLRGLLVLVAITFLQRRWESRHESSE